MNLPYRVYDVFAESPFAGTQIPVVMADQGLDDALKRKIVSEFSHADTVFVDQKNKACPFSVYNEKGKTTFGAHTTLAAAQTAFDLGLSKAKNDYFEFDLNDSAGMVNTFVDGQAKQEKLALFSRVFDFTTDRYVPEQSYIAEALSIDVKHLSYSRYSPMLVSVDNPVLVVPVTNPEHVVAAQLDTKRWSSLLAEVYANYILLFSPGSVSGKADFHGRLIHPNLKPKEYPPIGSVIPEFIAYLCACDETSEGTHTISVDRGGLDSRQSLIHAEFDNTGGNQAKCRIGGKVILMSQGEFVYQ